MRTSRTHVVVVAIAAAVLITAGAALLAQAPMQPGRYAVTSKMTMSGHEVQMPQRVNEICVTPEDLKDWSKKLVTGADATCKLLQYNMAGANLTFVRECTSRSTQTTTTYKGNMTFSPPNMYREVVNISSTGGTRETNAFLGGSTINMTATRVGDCAK